MELPRNVFTSVMTKQFQVNFESMNDHQSNTKNTRSEARAHVFLLSTTEGCVDCAILVQRLSDLRHLRKVLYAKTTT